MIVAEHPNEMHRTEHEVYAVAVEMKEEDGELQLVLDVTRRTK